MKVSTEKHDWAPRKYECCLAVVERLPYEAWSQPAKVDLLWRFCGWPSLLGGLQKRSGACAAEARSFAPRQLTSNVGP
ncbi:BQ5605_C013g07295 [Microbotryum silenes-dioicae]|uniref:BQ5605_C013g07295 protein n=1 Tax=Microbotryum silenes-dioicae TaxID=796604 RepID=A0A2X0LRN0_9BASI|nr:BQ5605_C013g07295 [Microbotryum silenes-dioicae]